MHLSIEKCAHSDNPSPTLWDCRLCLSHGRPDTSDGLSDEVLVSDELKDGALTDDEVPDEGEQRSTAPGRSPGTR